MVTISPIPRARQQPVYAQTPASDLAVRCRGVVKSFGRGEARVEVLHGTEFEARAGEMTFLVGPSGCGKTTLISIIGGILSCEAGDVRVLGQDIRRLRGGRAANFRLRSLGFIFQQFNLLPALTAAENASVALVAEGVPTRQAIRRADQMLARLGLDTHQRKFPNQLSGGQQQRVAIARALLHDPRLVICDEPTASLDATMGQTVMEMLREVALEGGRSVIVVTHDNRIFDFADRIARMSDGVIVEVENPVTGKNGSPPASGSPTAGTQGASSGAELTSTSQPDAPRPDASQPDRSEKE